MKWMMRQGLLVPAWPWVPDIGVPEHPAWGICLPCNPWRDALPSRNSGISAHAQRTNSSLMECWHRHCGSNMQPLGDRKNLHVLPLAPLGRSPPSFALTALSCGVWALSGFTGTVAPGLSLQMPVIRLDRFFRGAPVELHACFSRALCAKSPPALPGALAWSFEVRALTRTMGSGQVHTAIHATLKPPTPSPQSQHT